MSESHFRISKKIFVTIVLVVCGCFISLVIYTYQQEKSVILNGIKTNGDGIRSTTAVQQHLIQEVIRLDGADATHAASQVAHHSQPGTPGG